MIIPGFSKYNIEPDGTIMRIDNGRVIKHGIVTIRGYTYARSLLQDDSGKYRTRSVLELLAITFLGKTPGKDYAMAKDGNNLHTALDNIVIVSRSDVAAKSTRERKLTGRPRKHAKHDAERITKVYNEMLKYDTPVSMATLSDDLQIPYYNLRYAVVELRNRGRVRKTKKGFEVVR